MTSSGEHTLPISETASEGVFPSTTESTDLGDDSSVTRARELGLQEERPLRQVMIAMLPDHVLLAIFDFYREDPASNILLGCISTWRWKTLIQVCRRWRCVIFGSPRRLDLRVICTDTTPTTTSLDTWPPFPISIVCLDRADEKGVENIIAAVECHDRISDILINDIDGSALEKLAAAMQQPLPTLKGLCLRSDDESVPVLPETFLGGSAPSLEFVAFDGVPFPTLPKLLLSATHILCLALYDIPDSGHISPDLMANCLAELPNLKYLTFRFQSPLSHYLQIAPPRTRAVLSALTELDFSGVSEYFEDFVARIDTPLLNVLSIVFFADLDGLNFYIPRFRHFITRAEKLKQFNRARIQISGGAIGIAGGSPPQLELEVQGDSQLFSMVQIFRQHLPLFSHVEELEIFQFRFANMEWTHNPHILLPMLLELFHLFTALRSLYVSEQLVPTIAAILRTLTDGRAMEVLPALHNLFLEGYGLSGTVKEGIMSFVAARQLSDHPVAIQWVHQFRAGK